jgi:hypothetical protein
MQEEQKQKLVFEIWQEDKQVNAAEYKLKRSI